MTQTGLAALHVTTLQRSCLALAAATESVLLDPGLARTLGNLAGRLPGPLPAEAEPSGSLTDAQALPLVDSARASIEFLTLAGQFSDLGLRIADGLRATLDTVEEGLGQSVRARAQSRVKGLYVIIDPLATLGREPEAVAEGALDGGAAMLQLRDKERDKGLSLGLASALMTMCQEREALFIVNDHADLAASVNAHGVHVGQDDLPVSEARKLLNPAQLVGRSNHLPEEAAESQRMGADYVAVGAMYPTSSKDQPIIGGPETLRRTRELVTAPLVAIGGITQERVAEVVRAGADAVCVIGAVGLAPDPREAARRMVDAIAKAGGRV